MRYFFVYLFVLTGLMACKKNDLEQPKVPEPVISDFLPKDGVEGSVINISGSNLSNVVSVRLNSSEAFFQISGNTIRAIVPAGASTGQISVTSQGGTATSKNQFTVTAKPVAPIISDVQPNNNPIGWPVLITGTNMTNISKISFNGISAPIDTNFNGQVSTRVPLNISPGVAQLTVTNANGVSNSVPFTILEEIPYGQPPPAKIMFRAKARYLPLVTNNWINEKDNNYYLQLNESGSGTEGFFYNNFSAYFDLKVIYFNASARYIEVRVNRNEYGLTEKYMGTYVDSDVPNQDNPTRQRIIFVNEAGRQIVVSVKI